MSDFRGLRVLRPFTWMGWNFAPKDGCRCTCSKERLVTVRVPKYNRAGALISIATEPQMIPGPVSNCTHQPGTACACNETVCDCPCGMPVNNFGGDVWVVDIAHQLEAKEGRVYAMVELSRFAVPDVVANQKAVDANGVVRPEFQKLLGQPPVPAAA